MRWDELNEQTCSITRAMSTLGDRWTMLVIRQIFMRIRRFSEIQRSLGITKHRLADRLNRLVEDGVVYKQPYGERKARFEYKLTEKGIDLYPVLLGLAKWGDKWMADEDGKPMVYIHKVCDCPADPVVSCSNCGGEIDAMNTFAKPGPGITKKLSRGEFSDSDVKLYARSLELPASG